MYAFELYSRPQFVSALTCANKKVAGKTGTAPRRIERPLLQTRTRASPNPTPPTPPTTHPYRVRIHPLEQPSKFTPPAEAVEAKEGRRKKKTLACWENPHRLGPVLRDGHGHALFAAINGYIDQSGKVRSEVPSVSTQVQTSF